METCRERTRTAEKTSRKKRFGIGASGIEREQICINYINFAFLQILQGPRGS